MSSIVPRVVHRHAFRLLLAATATAITAATLLASSSVAAPPGVLELPTSAAVTDLTALRDGSVGISAGVGDGRFWKTSIVRLGDRGELGAPLMVDRRSTYAAGAFSPGGELTLMRYPRWTAGRNASVELRTIAGDGQPIGKSRTFRAGRRQQILGATPQVGPTGAALVQLTESTPTGHRLAVAFRPAGATKFAARVRLRSTTRAEAKRSDHTGDGIDTTFKFAFDPGGSGALLALPESRTAGAPYVRRIAPTGRLGPKIDVGLAAGSATAGDLAFDQGGRLHLAIASWRRGSITWATEGRAYAGSLAAGSNTVSSLQDLGKVTDGTENLVLDLAALSGDRSAVLIGAEFQTDLRLFEGTGPLNEVSASGVGWRNIEMRALPSGALLFTWEEVGNPGVYASVRAPEGAMSAPKRLTPEPATDSNAIVRNLAVLGDGRVALAWTELSLGATDRTYATIATP